MKITFLLLLPLLFAATVSPAAPKLAYLLSMDEPHTHYFAVEMRLTDLDRRDYLDVKMATWTPGSYLIREYAKNVEAFVATDGKGAPLRSEKVSKNTWRVYLRNAADLRVTYRLYANELTVRTSYVDAAHGYVNGASMFMYPDQMQQLPSTLTIRPFAGWTAVSTALDAVPGEKFTFSVPSYDTLVDSPIEIGTHPTLRFEAAGVPHRVAMFGAANYEPTRLLSDMKKICEEATKVVGEHPCKNYLFLVHNLVAGGGGLEHLNSTSLQTSRAGYATETGYNGFLGLVAHEYFHLWNVKRIRPKALGPFDYENENYTHGLWVAEGVTSYYDDYLLRRAQLTTPDQYLTTVLGNINSVETAPGNRVQSLAEASWDAWIKYYRPNENSNNATVSYYTKGGVVTMLLDLLILDASAGQRSFDDVLRLLYQEYYKKQQRGFTDAEMQAAVEKVAGKKLDDFFQNHIFGTQPPDYNAYFRPVGLQLVDASRGRSDAYLGAATAVQNGRLVVTSVMRGTAAYAGGLNAGDELLAADGLRLTDDINRYVASKKVGEELRLLVNRNGDVLPLDITLARSPASSYRFERLPNPTAAQTALFNQWLRIE